MRRIWLKRTIGFLLSSLIVAGAVWFGWPRPIPADLATVESGSMEVTVDDEGKTRIRHVYTVYAPIAGRILRISRSDGYSDTSRHVGDRVVANETIVAVMQPVLPSFLDIRSREELEAAVVVAEAAVRLAEAEVRRIQVALDLSRNELRRAQALARTDAISVRALDEAKFDVEANEAALASAIAQLDMRRGEHDMSTARLIDPTNAAESASLTCCVQIRAPVTGSVLKIIQESETVVPAGAPLLEIGDPLDLEVVAELLSTDAVQIDVGAPVRIDGWGGSPVRGRVTRVDPTGFTEISALGIEEQRVETVIDFVDPAETWARLGHDYRVIVHITIWSAEDVLTVPVSALFRKGDDWAVFAVRDGRARMTIVKIGHRNGRVAELLSGLSAGDQIVLHPSDRISEGTAVSEREIR